MTKNQSAEPQYITNYRNYLLEKLEKFLSADKPADVLIIKAHLLTEYYLNQLRVLRKRQSLKKVGSMGFASKLSDIFNTNDSDEKSLKIYVERLNRLRNRVGHELDYRLAESDIDNLGSAMDSQDYVLRKYDHASLHDLLRDVLADIVIYVALLLRREVHSRKQKQ